MVLAVLTMSVLVGVGGPARAKVPGPNGQILFGRFDPAFGDTLLYTVNPDGSHLKQVVPFTVECPHWSPDGSLIATCGAPDGGSSLIINPDTGSFREVFSPDPTLFLACPVWSPDAKRLACGQFQPPADPSRAGMYSIRSSDGGDVRRITSNPGGEDNACDYSPDGTRLVFIRTSPDGSEALYTVKIDGTGVHQITPTTLTDYQCGSWSPQGDQIVFAARSAPDQRRSIWVVDSKGTGLHQVPIQPSCGGAFSDRTSRSCQEPSWSPDGTKIAFDIFVAATEQRSIYTVNADGSGLFQLTHHGSKPGEGDEFPDWGPHPLAA